MRHWNFLHSLLINHLLLQVLGKQRFEIRRFWFVNRHVDHAHIPRGGSVDKLLPPWGIQPVLADTTNATRITTAENPVQSLSEVPSNNTPTSTSTTPRPKIPQWKLSLPEPLRSKNSQTIQKLCMFGCIDIYILGTAHVSNDSSADVQQLLSHIEPDCILLELCDARMSLLGNNNNNELMKNVTSTCDSLLDAKAVQNMTWKERFSKWKSRNGTSNTDDHLPGTNSGSWFQTMSTVLLTSVQEDYAAQLGVELGGEFRCAHQYWFDRQQKQLQQQQQQLKDVENPSSNDKNSQTQRSPPHLILGDRPVQITLMRAWESLSWWARIKVCAGLVWSALPFGKPSTEELRAWLASVMQNDGSDILSQSLEELRQSFPTLHTTIIAERDAWLAAKIIQTSHALQIQYEQQQLVDSENDNNTRRRSIVAVVGAGHVPGIVQWLTAPRTEKTTEQVLAELVTTKRWAKDAVVQQELIPSWILDVVEVNTEMSILQEQLK